VPNVLAGCQQSTVSLDAIKAYNMLADATQTSDTLPASRFQAAPVFKMTASAGQNDTLRGKQETPQPRAAASDSWSGEIFFGG